VLSRSVRDSAALLDLTHGPEEVTLPHEPRPLPPPETGYLGAALRDPKPLRIAFWAEPFHDTPIDPDCRAAATEAAALCASLGHHVEEVRPPIPGWEVLRDLMVILMGTVAGEIDQRAQELGRKPRFGEIEVPTKLAELMGRAVTAGEMSGAFDRIGAWARNLGPFFTEYDVLITPVTAIPAVPIGHMKEKGAEALLHSLIARTGATRVLKWANAVDEATEKAWGFYAFTPYWNLTGQPAASVPLHWTAKGLPVGTQIIGRFGEEATLLALAGQMERARPWSGRQPRLA
jgi:amidase